MKHNKSQLVTGVAGA